MTSPFTPQDVSPPIFGAPLTGLTIADYAWRPAAHGLVLNDDGLLAVAQITMSGAGQDRFEYDLPGGGVDRGETEPVAMVREVEEETGLIVSPGPVITRAGQIAEDKNGYWIKTAAFYVADYKRADGLKIEDDHTLVWMTPIEATTQLRYMSHAYAVLTYLRRRLERAKA